MAPAEPSRVLKGWRRTQGDGLKPAVSALSPAKLILACVMPGNWKDLFFPEVHGLPGS